LLTRDQVDHIDVIELDRKIVDRIGPEFAGNDRVTLHHADALTFPLNGQRWDFAWHDLWDESRPLAMLHADVMTRFFTKVTRQGAWELPRWVKRRWGRSEWLMNRRIKLP
jgi:16S rRNA A1518/A1519 N6-dimethyltransferase RsmA/KsgA/DIM1 with predicted DNA glycosylase/AP lyase activity